MATLELSVAEHARKRSHGGVLMGGREPELICLGAIAEEKLEPYTRDERIVGYALCRFEGVEEGYAW